MYFKYMQNSEAILYVVSLIISSPTEKYEIMINLCFFIFHAWHENCILVCSGIILLNIKDSFHLSNLVVFLHNQNSYSMIRQVECLIRVVTQQIEIIF